MKNADEMKMPVVRDSIKNLLTHHLESFQENDLGAVISDYTEESVLITPDATYTGIKEIKSFFSGLIPHFPKDRTRFYLDKIVTHGNLAYIIWHATTPTLAVQLGSDSFIIRDGKIYQQTFVAAMEFLT